MSNKWVEIPGYEGRYKISTSKKVKMVSRDIKDKDGNLIRKIEESEVSIKEDKITGEKYVVLHNGEKYVKENLDNLISRSF